MEIRGCADEVELVILSGEAEYLSAEEAAKLPPVSDSEYEGAPNQQPQQHQELQPAQQQLPYDELLRCCNELHQLHHEQQQTPSYDEVLR